MNLLQQQLVRRREYLQQLKEEIERQSIELPYGRLRVNNDRGIPRYYYIGKSGDTHGEYISKKNMELARKLAQKDYLQKLCHAVEDELKTLEKCLFHQDRQLAEKVYANLNEYRQALVSPLVISNEEFAKKWQQEPYETNPYYPEEKVYTTKRDELVRSKSEVLLADMFYEMGIPYRYEAQLILQNGKIKYPDFTLLKVHTRELIFHGKNLMITYEGEGSYLNIKEIKMQVQAILDIPIDTTPCYSIS